jgi:D-sedoheptulose 7-phosphate isomerase
MFTSSRSYIAELTTALSRLDVEQIERIADAVYHAYLADRTVFCCGHGGSAAAATHLAADISKLTAVPGRPRLKAMALTDSTAALTAAANDFAYDQVFVEQLRTFMAPGDIVIGISTSGRSRNVLLAVEYANAHGGLTIGVTGADGSLLRQMTHESLSIASLSVQQVEDLTVVAAHLLCLLTREKCLAHATELVPGRRAERTGRPRSVAGTGAPPAA